MRGAVRKIGDSAGVVIPDRLLAAFGVAIGDEVRVMMDGERLVITRADHDPRAGWEDAAKQLAAEGDDGPVWPEFANDGDKDLKW